MKRHPVLLALPLAGILLASACAAPPPAPEGAFARAPILLVGLDGFEWSGVLPLLRSGRLPTLAALIRRGAYGTLETFPGRVSPALWTSIATGKQVEKHGIYDFLKERNPPVFYASTDRKTKAFWNILSDRGRRVDTVGWFVTHPAEAVNGVMVAQTNTREVRRTHRTMKGAVLPGVEGQVYPAEREEQVFSIMEEVEAQIGELVARRLETSTEHPPKRLRGIIEASTWAFRADAIYERMAVALASEGAPDLLAVYFGSTDVVAHRFWPLARPRENPGHFFMGATGKRLAPHMRPGTWWNALLGGPFWSAMEPQAGDRWAVRVLRRTYESADAALGRLVAAMPAETTVIVVSDHGFRPWGHEDGPDAFFLAAGTNVRPRDGAPPPEKLTRSDLPRLGSILDVTPTLLALTGIPAGRDMDGRVLETAFRSLPGTTRVAPIASHDSPEWLAARAARGEAPVESGDDEDERLEQLKALGYIK
jgi:predicted AlkP superfamily phosphohydrolase/phosphomutase